MAQSCAPYRAVPLGDADPSYMRAACVSQAHLRKNGYLESLEEFDLKDIDAEIWDFLRTTDGIDWNKIVRERAGSFANRLYGVQRESAEYFTVYYRSDSRYFQCVDVKADLSSAYLQERGCKRTGVIVRLSEKDLQCEA